LSCPCDVNSCIVHMNQSQGSASFLKFSCIFWVSGLSTSSQKNGESNVLSFGSQQSCAIRWIPQKMTSMRFSLAVVLLRRTGGSASSGS
jgi:hypothetical protein